MVEEAIGKLIEALVEAAPGFAGAVDEHLSFYDELLPHVLFGDLTRFILAAEDTDNHATASACLKVLDEALTWGDRNVENLVGVSFVENVPPWDPERASFIAGWPKRLRAEADRQRTWRLKA